ncbi:hypothetical protein [Pseudonocardia sp. N23]|uniref:hypothetical protein n=1 Tax=Pseudonocardia sp. N23 TaxID=1987376 RepID=UPI0015594B68|nr:hypothetical protein [Pseudonocardia sp. N23]
MTTALAATEIVDDDPDRVISATVRALVSANRVDTGRLAEALQMSRQSYYNRVNGEKPWHAKDVARAARFFAVPIQDIYSGTVRIGPNGPGTITT